MNRPAMRMTRRMDGFSLVELMVAMTLSLVLLAGALSILYTSKVTYTENERVARLQEAGRTVVELILRDARAAGYVGCSRPLRTEDFVNGLAGSGTLPYNLQQPLLGFDTAPATAGWLPALDASILNAAPGSDVVAVRSSRQGQPIFRTTGPVNPLTPGIPVTRAANVVVPTNTPMIISDCRGASVFWPSGVATPTPTTATIAHAPGGPPGNTGPSLTRGFEIGAQVTPVQTVVYYVRLDAVTGLPALWQKIGANPARPLIEGVENMQITYGEDTTADQLADRYVTADMVGNWANVISFSISILVRSEDETGLDVDNRTYNLLGTNVGPFTDRRQRSVFTTTVTLRNVAT
jgi:type IV pilus assembly protein PilW